MTTATIALTAVENWTTLVNSVDYLTLTTKLDSSTSYTVTDPTSKLTLQVIGTGFTATNVFGYNLLATGTITGFKLSQNGLTIATGSNYSLTSSSLLSALESSLLSNNAWPLFNYWYSVPTTISGTAAVVEGNLANLKPYVNIVAIDITSGAVTVSATDFAAYRALLDKIAGGFSITDASPNVAKQLAGLETDVAHLTALHLTNPSPAFNVAIGQLAAANTVFAKIVGAYVVNVHNLNGSWTTTGHGANLTIRAVASVDAITGGGVHETFVFRAGAGHATLVDFHSHLTGAFHDTLVLSAAEFGSFATMHKSQSGANVLLTAGTDVVTLQAMTLAQLALAATDFKFV